MTYAFNKGDLSQLMTTLASAVHAHGQPMDLYIFGGAALVLENQIARDVTADVDTYASSTKHRALLRELRREVAAKEELNPLWMSINASADLKDMVAERDKYFTPALPELKGSGLSVYLLKPEAQLAMKLFGAVSDKPERADKDKQDITKLAATLGISNGEGLMSVWDRHKGKMGESQVTLETTEQKLRASAFIKRFGTKSTL